jgi:hypothetical protein
MMMDEIWLRKACGSVMGLIERSCMKMEKSNFAFIV